MMQAFGDQMMKTKASRFLFYLLCFLVIFITTETLFSCDDSIVPGVPNDPGVSDNPGGTNNPDKPNNPGESSNPGGSSSPGGSSNPAELPPGFHVTTTGAAGGSGALADPWDLQTALNHPSAVKPGDIIYIHEGTYYGAYVSKLNGTAGKAITVCPWYDETVIIDSCKDVGGLTATLEFNGSCTYIMGLTIMNSNPDHYVPNANGLEGVRYFGSNNKLINCVIHDNTGNGIGFWSSAVGSEVAGCIIYHNGTINPDRGHGHGLYVQNDSDTYKLIHDNIIFNSFGKGAQIYGTSVGVRNVKMTNNVIFNSALAASNSIEQGIYAGGEKPVNNIILNDNIFYVSPQYNMAVSAKFGHENVQNGYGEFKNNICIDAYLHITKNWDKITTRNNAYISKSSKTRMVFGFDVLTNVTARDYDQNKYYLGEIGENGGTWNGFTLYPLSTIQNNPFNPAYSTELNSVYYDALPTEDLIVVQPNPYQSGRAHITIHNWTGKSKVSVDVSSILSPGDMYELYDVTYLSGGPIIASKYSGAPIEIPMNLSNVDMPIGLTSGLDRFKNTAPDFGVFLLKRVTETPK